ncbi:MAG: hypothetical protein EOO73_08010 [Myxococcales bacterium]|nr:MAG: hypothetical protein EOO73_08010 [Myxococcales bacterium]
MNAPRAPGAQLLHPVMLGALLLLVVNDHVLKRLCPSPLTGKLSDVAVVVVLPVFLHGVVELVHSQWLHRPLSAKAANRWLGVCLALSLLVFALPEVWPPAEAAYRYGLGAAQWPFKAAWRWALSEALPPLRPVRATADWTDLLTMPTAWLAFHVAKRSPG